MGQKGYFKMGSKPLAFAGEDIDLIQSLKRRQARQAATQSAAASRAAVAGQ